MIPVLFTRTYHHAVNCVILYSSHLSILLILPSFHYFIVGQHDSPTQQKVHCQKTAEIVHRECDKQFALCSSLGINQNENLPGPEEEQTTYFGGYLSTTIIVVLSSILTIFAAMMLGKNIPSVSVRICIWSNKCNTSCSEVLLQTV